MPLREQPPEQTLRAARRLALGTGAAIAVVFGLSSVLIGKADSLAPTHVLTDPGWFPLLVLGLMVGVGGGLWAILAQVWGRYTVTRLYLALRGRLPWRPIRFLHDAQRRGLLERDGSVFAFRHELMREMLVRPARQDEEVRPGRGV